MSKELRIGIISLFTLAVMVWGFQYLKGKNLLAKGYTFDTILDNVEGLEVASPVEINGLTVGAISSIKINPEDVRTMIVTFDIEGEFQLPNTTYAVNAAPSGVIGNRKIILDFDELCSGDNCLKGGERLPSKVRGLIASMMGENELENTMLQMRQNIGPMMDTVLARMSDTNEDNTLGNSLQNIEQLTANLSALTIQLNRVIRTNQESMTNTFNNLASLTGSLAASREDYQKMMANFALISEQLASADLGTTLAATSETVEGTNKLITQLQESMDKASITFDNMNSLTTKLNNGEGTIGKLLTDSEIYDNLETTSQHLALLLQDLRLNPKRYVKLSIFGRKNQPYTNPQDDPALHQDIQIKVEGN